MQKKEEKTRYHHGDLATTLVDVALTMIENEGIESLSLRKLAQNIGVSRTAAYHHFTNKQQLLAAVTAKGFILWSTEVKLITDDPRLSEADKFTQYVYRYVEFSTKHPALYRLMFGHLLWKHPQDIDQLRDVAYPSFQQQVALAQHWQQHGLLNPQLTPLRLAQVLWGSLHGIAMLFIDGIYQSETSIHAMCDSLITVFLSHNHG